MDSESTLISSLKPQPASVDAFATLPTHIEQSSSPKKSVSGLMNDKALQRDAMILIGVYVVLNSEMFQQFMSSKMPSAYAGSRANTFGLVVQGVVLVAAWQVIKRVVKDT